MRTLVRAHTLLTQSRIHGTLPSAGLIVEDGVIRRVGLLTELEPQGPFDATVGDAARHVVLPGMVNAHHHTLRPNRIGYTPGFLEVWLLRNRLRPLPVSSEEEAYDQTLWGALQVVKSGGTAVLDHFQGEPRLDGFGLPAGVQAYLDAGVRAAVCLACADQNPVVYEDAETFYATLPADLADELRPRFRPLDADGFFAAWERLFAAWDGKDGRVRIGLAPGQPQTCSEALLRRVRRAADEHNSAPVQIHLLESRLQAMYGQRRFGRSVCRYLADAGFFGPATSCAHCVWVTADDIQILADAGAVAVHNPSSNLLLFSGIAPVADLLDGGVRVGFGLDAASFNDSLDMLTDLRLGLLLQRSGGGYRPRVMARDMLGLATWGGAAALGLGERLGRLEAGYQADAVFVDRTELYASPYVDRADPPEEVLLRRASMEHVEHVMVGGRLVVRDRKSVTVDEAALGRRLARAMERVYGQLAEMDGLFRRLEPHVTAFYQQWAADAPEVLPPNYRVNMR